MATKKTDWKREREKMKQEGKSAQTPFPGEAAGWFDKGKTMLEGGTRQSLRNDLGGKATSMDVLLRMWEENRKARTAVRKKKTNYQSLKGLFGGGE